MMNLCNRAYKSSVDLLCTAFDLCHLSHKDVRYMSRIKSRFTMPPFWQPKKIRVNYPEHLTKENVEYLDEEVKQKYLSPLKVEMAERGEWRPGSYRCGLIARKIGVYPMWEKSGKRRHTTLLHIPDNQVIKYIPPEKMEENHHKYHLRDRGSHLGGLVVGADSADPRKFTKEYLSLFKEVGIYPKKRMTKFFITPNAKLAPGTPLFASHFKPGDFVDCGGITVDRGYQGVMKRWDFKGGRRTHGTTKSHRRPGNIGGGSSLARVWPGKKMPGHMGRHFRHLRGVEVLRVNTVYNVIWVCGHAVPGEVGNYVILYDSLLPKNKRTEDTKPHFPTFFQEEEEIEEELCHEKLHSFAEPSIQIKDK